MTPEFGAEDLTDALFHKIAKFVYEHARINLTDNKRELVRARLGKIIRLRGFKGYHDYYNYMVADTTGEAVREVMNAVSTNLTSFFRESKHFDFLRESLLPQLAAAARASGHYKLRAWSAGCSTGEEPYTIAITLLETLPELARWDMKLLASDLDTEVVAEAAAGVYEATRFKGIPPPLARKYFQSAQTGSGAPAFAAKPELKRVIAFRHLNLMHDWPFRGRFDFIFCRNVMIYFDRETQENLVNRFHRYLAVGGHLFIGHSEGLTGVKHRFQYVLPTIYRKTSE